MSDSPGPTTLVVMEGDQTGQELLEEALRVIDPEVTGLPLVIERYDLSLENRRRTRNQVVFDAAEATKRHGFGLKAATVTPEDAGDVGSPNALLREAIGGKVDHPHRPAPVGRAAPRRHPRADLDRPDGGRRRLQRPRVPRDGGRRRDRLAHRAHLASHLPRRRRVLVPAGPAHARHRLRRPQVDGLPGLRGDAQGGARRRGHPPPRRPLQAAPDRRALRGADQPLRRRARGAGAQPRRRLPLGHGAAALRLHRRAPSRSCWPSTRTSARRP